MGLRNAWRGLFTSKKDESKGKRATMRRKQGNDYVNNW